MFLHITYIRLSYKTASHSLYIFFCCFRPFRSLSSLFDLHSTNHPYSVIYLLTPPSHLLALAIECCRFITRTFLKLIFIGVSVDSTFGSMFSPESENYVRERCVCVCVCVSRSQKETKYSICIYNARKKESLDRIKWKVFEPSGVWVFFAVFLFPSCYGRTKSVILSSSRLYNLFRSISTHFMKWSFEVACMILLPLLFIYICVCVNGSDIFNGEWNIEQYITVTKEKNSKNNNNEDDDDSDSDPCVHVC